MVKQNQKREPEKQLLQRSLQKKWSTAQQNMREGQNRALWLHVNLKPPAISE